MGVRSSWIVKFYDKTYENKSLEELCKAPVSAISGISESDAKDLKKAFGIEKVEDLATNKYVKIAQLTTEMASIEVMDFELEWKRG